MNFVISSTLLLNHLQSVSKVINSKNTLPILDNVLFHIQKNELVLTASDLETTIISKISLENVTGSGQIAIDAKRLMSTLRETPEQPLTFNINNDTLAVEITTERARFNMMGMNGIDFPALPGLKEEKTVSLRIKTEYLANGINKTLFATANDDLRPVMNGIYIQVVDGEMTMVASDSHKLVRYIYKNVKSEVNSSFILPQKPAMMLKNILPKNDPETEIMLEFDDKNAYFVFNDYKLVCRLVEGRYPSYDAVIPQNNPNRMIVDRLDFLNALRRVSVYTNPASSLIKIEYFPNETIVSGQDIDFSISAVEHVSCIYEGDAMEMGFKSLFLIEILSNLSSTQITMQMSDPSRAGIIVPTDNENEEEDILMLIMPMMVG